jgi:hypothetical protein
MISGTGREGGQQALVPKASTAGGDVRPGQAKTALAGRRTPLRAMRVFSQQLVHLATLEA